MQNVFCAINFPLKREVRKEVRLPFQMESACGKVYVRQRNPNGGGATVLRELNVASNAEGERYLVAKKEARYGRRRRFSDCDQVRPYNPNGKLLGLAECCVAFVSAHLDLLESLQDRVEPIAGVGVAGVDSLAKLVGGLLELESRDSRVRVTGVASFANFAGVGIGSTLLQDFPEEIGGRIWRRALGDGNCERNLGVFAEAYPRAFLPDCRISRRASYDRTVSEC